MHLSRLLRVSLVLGVAAGATVIACGSSGTKTPDGKTFKDAKVFLDGSGSGGSGGIGHICTSGSNMGSAGLCPTSDPICTSLGGAWFCTESCGTGPCATGGSAGSSSCFGTGSNQPQPPSGGDAICMSQSSSGTPVCGLYGPGPGSGNMAVAWACGILCGTSGSNNFGTCPTGLTCTQNFCQ
jgi:hypothetical protein